MVFLLHPLLDCIVSRLKPIMTIVTNAVVLSHSCLANANVHQIGRALNP